MTKPTDTDIAAQRELLETYRRRLAFNIAQRAKLGTLAPFSLDEEIHEARAEIRRIKQWTLNFVGATDYARCCLEVCQKPCRRSWARHFSHTFWLAR
jgi:hypothetical protein